MSASWTQHIKLHSNLPTGLIVLHMSQPRLIPLITCRIHILNPNASCCSSELASHLCSVHRWFHTVVIVVILSSSDCFQCLESSQQKSSLHHAIKSLPNGTPQLVIKLQSKLDVRQDFVVQYACLVRFLASILAHRAGRRPVGQVGECVKLVSRLTVAFQGARRATCPCVP